MKGQPGKVDERDTTEAIRDLINNRERTAATLTDHADDVFTVLRLIYSVTTLQGLANVRRRAKALEETMITEIYAASGTPGSLEDARRNREAAADEARAQEIAASADPTIMVMEEMMREVPEPDETGRWEEQTITSKWRDGSPYAYTIYVPIGEWKAEVERRRTEEKRLRDEVTAEVAGIEDPNVRDREWVRIWYARLDVKVTP